MLIVTFLSVFGLRHARGGCDPEDLGVTLFAGANHLQSAGQTVHGLTVIEICGKGARSEHASEDSLFLVVARRIARDFISIWQLAMNPNP